MALIKTGKRWYIPQRAIHRIPRWFEIRAKSDLKKWERLEKHWIVAGELGNVLEKVLRDFDKLFQKIGAVWLNERCDILREDVVGRSRVRWSEEQVKPVDLIFKFSEVLGLMGMEKIVREMIITYIWRPVRVTNRCDAILSLYTNFKLDHVGYMPLHNYYLPVYRYVARTSIQLDVRV